MRGASQKEAASYCKEMVMQQRLTMGLIGENISRTRLPAALEIMCAQHGLTLSFTPIDSKGDDGFDFDATVARLIADGWDGVTVTHPFKLNAAKAAGNHAPQGAGGTRLAASNLLKFSSPLIAYNTDYSGFIHMWRRLSDRAPGHVAMAGAGGVASAIGPALIQLGAESITIWDVDDVRADELARSLGPTAQAIRIAEAEAACASSDGLINATSLGMAGYGGTAFEPHWLTHASWAFDAVYTPNMTPFLTAAKSAGLTCLSGFSLFQSMAIETFTTYTGLPVDGDNIIGKLEALRPDD
jgi:shikimate dehydrogenase